MIVRTQFAVSLADPPGSSVVVAATAWVQATFLGTLATIVAVIAVAAVGLLMLSGRVDPRRGLAVLTGCFILFGAPVIANGLRAMTGDVVPLQNTGSEMSAAPPDVVIAPTPGIYDPYAGAAVQR